MTTNETPQPRDHAVPCLCGAPTFNVNALCDKHQHLQRL